MRTDRGFTLVELMTVVVILGVLAAIAIPLYMRFVQQSRTGEAQTNIGKIAQLAVEHYARTTAITRSAAIHPGTNIWLFARLPATERTGGGSCDATPAVNGESVPRLSANVQRAAYQPDINEWRCSSPGPGCSVDTAWALLRFEIGSPIRYQYCYASNAGVAPSPPPDEQVFVVVASGDLDGDDRWSRFMRRGQTVPGGDLAIGPLAVVNEDE